MMDGSRPAQPRRGGLPASIWALGIVSLFMDMSSELVHALLPVFLVSGLGASMVAVGFIEGAAEATASITKVFSGVISDWIGKRKLLTVVGYGLAALTKPLFPLATTVDAVFAARFIDRIGKGIRGAPRDALIADIVSPEQRGAAYGLRQALDTAGAVAGPLLAVLFMWLLADNIRAVFWVATVPAIVAVLVLIFAVREPEHHDGKAKAPFRLADLRELDRHYWGVVAVAGVLTLARFSEAFLVLRAQSSGLAIAYVPLVMVVMSGVYTLAAYPAGLLADRLDRRSLLALGFAVLIAADIVLAEGTTPIIVFAGVALWGLHMGLTQGLLSTLVADAAPSALRGSAFGIFNLICGGVLLAASAIAGMLWQGYGPAATFYVGAIITAGGLAGLLVVRSRSA
ncbi:MFS transporter [Parvibaculum sp.]|uniref:MFS transporter n=1 Tax=Parvibaculum sp. TaxID=2024848 RepID=UPI003210B5D9